MGSRKSAVQSLGRRKVDVVCFAVMTPHLNKKKRKNKCILHFAVHEFKLSAVRASGARCTMVD